MQADYSGPMSLATCLYLGDLVHRHADGRPTIERVDKSMTMAQSGSTPDLSYLLTGSLMGCYIVREDQYDLMQDLCAMLAQLGVTRLTFLESRFDLALRWALDH